MAYVRLQRPDLCRDGRLRYVKLLRRPRKAFLSRDFQESLQLIDVHLGPFVRDAVRTEDGSGSRQVSAGLRRRAAQETPVKK